MSVLDEHTTIPLRLVLGAAGGVTTILVTVVLAWATLSAKVEASSKDNAEQAEIIRLIVSQQGELKTSIAVISAKQNTTIERLDRIGAKMSEILTIHVRR